MAFRNISRSSDKLISQGLFRLAREGSISTLSGGLASNEELGTVVHLRRFVVDHPGNAPSGVDPVGHVAFGHEHVSEGYGDYLGFGGLLLEEPGKAVRINRVQSSINLVEQVEWMLLDGLHGQYHRHSSDGPLPSTVLR